VTRAHIGAIRTFLPERVITNAALTEEFPSWNAERIQSKTGVLQRHVAAEDQPTSVLAVEAAEKLLQDTRIDRLAIDQLILCTQTPDHLVPSTSCLVHHRLGLSSRCGAFDINMGCSGYIYGLSAAKAYIASDQASTVLLVNADTYTKLLRPDDLATRAIFGDGATATLISRSSGARIDAVAFGTDGSRYEDFIAHNSGMTRDNTVGRHISMDGPGIFNFTIARIPAELTAFLSGNGVPQSDVRYFVFHQANSYMLKHLQKKMAIDETRMPIRLSEVGNLVSASIPALLEELLPTLHPGDRIVLVGFGVGLSWGFVLLTWQADSRSAPHATAT
jgi:3-oxoacyl-[acyl-carrier-protein] synthase III